MDTDIMAVVCYEYEDEGLEATLQSEASFLLYVAHLYPQNITFESLINKMSYLTFDDMHDLRQYMNHHNIDHAYICRTTLSDEAKVWSVLIREDEENMHLYSLPEYMEAKGLISFDDDEDSLELT